LFTICYVFYNNVHLCLAVKTDGTLWAWGQGARGQTGQNNTAYTSSPVQVGALTNWSKISGKGQTSVAIKTDGTLWLWGANSYGQCLDNTSADKSSPVQLGSATNWSKISTMYNATFVIPS
jgi:alpha-tubulin suppressor-like RCC1 family protein